MDAEQPTDAFGQTQYAEPDPAAARSKWPAIIGTISIVLGGLGLLCYGCGSLNTIVSPMLVSAMPEDQRPATPQGMMLVLQVAQTCAAFLLSLWLLFAGIGIVRRRSWGRGGHIGWAIMKIITAIAGMLIGLVFLPDSVQQINDQLNQGTGPPPFEMTEGVMLVILVVMSVWAILWPIFVLLWFLRGNVREEVRGWALEDRAMI